MEHLFSVLKESNPILIVGLLIFMGHFFSAIFKKTNIPDVLPLIIIGMILGSSKVDMVHAEDIQSVGTVFGTIALALILFEGGSHLQFESLRKSLKDCLKLSIITFIATVVITTLLLSIVDLKLALFAGIVLGSISPAVVVPVVDILKVSEKAKTTVIVESAITDVLSIVLGLAIINSFKSGSIDIMHILGKQLFVALIMSLIFGFIGALIWSIILNKIRKFPNTIFTTLGFVFILYGFVETFHFKDFHFNGALTILVFGLIIANSSKIPLNILEFTNVEKTLFSEIIFIVKTFFFVYLGICLASQLNKLDVLLYGLVLTIAIYIARYVLTWILGPNDITKRETNLLAFMVPKGLAAAVLAQILITTVKPTADMVKIQSIIYSVIFFSIVLSTILIYFEESKKKEARKQ